MPHAFTKSMGVRRFQDLRCWQLCVQLHERIVAVTAREAVKKDARFCEQILESSGAPAPNIAEGFARFSKREFRLFLRYALASLAETQTHLEQGRQRKHFSAEEFREVMALANRAAAATSNLRRSIPGLPDR